MTAGTAVVIRRTVAAALLTFMPLTVSGCYLHTAREKCAHHGGVKHYVPKPLVITCNDGTRY